MPEVKSGREESGVVTALLAFMVAVLYATARYNVFKGVPWSDWPSYTLNKAFALSALMLVVLAVIRRRMNRPKGVGSILHMAGLLMVIHVVISSCLLTPAYFGKYFQQDKLTSVAGVSMTLGAIAMAVMAFGSKSGTDSSLENKNKKLAVLAFASGLHAALLGYPGWFTPSLWPGRLLPITLIAFLLGLAALVAVAVPKPRA